jgi:hypothetical protein
MAMVLSGGRMADRFGRGETNVEAARFERRAGGSNGHAD